MSSEQVATDIVAEETGSAPGAGPVPERKPGRRVPSLLTRLRAVAGAVLGPPCEAVGPATPRRADSSASAALDDAVPDFDIADPEPGMLAHAGQPADGSLHTSLFRSTCPVTGQPDYADVFVRYRGPRIERAGLLRYLVSYRRHAAFHEACVERIFVDIADRCGVEKLSVYARFLRRGGIDINPFRSNFESAPPENVRTRRQ